MKPNTINVKEGEREGSVEREEKRITKKKQSKTKASERERKGKGKQANKKRERSRNQGKKEKIQNNREHKWHNTHAKNNSQSSLVVFLLSSFSLGWVQFFLYFSLCKAQIRALKVKC